MPFAIAIPVASDAATLTASSESPLLPASNLLVADVFDAWRTLAESAYLTLDFGATTSVRLVWLGYANATADATWRIRGADTEPNLTAAPGYDSGTLSHWPSPDLSEWSRTHAFLWLDGTIAWRWWRIDVDNVGGGYYQARRLYLSDPWSPLRGMDFGFVPAARIEEGYKRRANSGALYARARGSWREAEFTLSYSDRDTLLKEANRLELLRGAHRDVLVMMDTDEPRYYMEQSLYGVLQSLSPVTNIGKASLRVLGLEPTYRKRFSFEEMEHP